MQKVHCLKFSYMQCACRYIAIDAISITIPFQFNPIGQNKVTEVTEVTLGKILAVITEADQPPPMGFHQEPCIRFIEDRSQTLSNASGTQVRH